MHPIVHNSTIYNSQDMQTTQVPINRWMDKKDGGVYIYIYTVEYYSAIKKNEILTFSAMWVDLEDIMLSEVKSEKDKLLCDITYIWSLKQ